MAVDEGLEVVSWRRCGRIGIGGGGLLSYINAAPSTKSTCLATCIWLAAAPLQRNAPNITRTDSLCNDSHDRFAARRRPSRVVVHERRWPGYDRRRCHKAFTGSVKADGCFRRSGGGRTTAHVELQDENAPITPSRVWNDVVA